MASIALSAGPAHAAGSVGSEPHVLYDGCRDYAYTVQGSNDSASEWALDLTLYAPSGDTSSSDFEYGTGSAVSRTGTFSICAYEGVGTYTIEGTLTWYDNDYNEVGTDVLSGPMRMLRQPTRSSLSANDTTPEYNSVVRFRLRSRQATPDGWRNNAYEYVALEANCGAGWDRVRGSKTTTDAYGKASHRYRWNTRKTCRVRTYTLPTVNGAGSRSTAVRINPH